MAIIKHISVKNRFYSDAVEYLTCKFDAVSYTHLRVSTSMQVDGYSLDAQKDKLRKYHNNEYVVSYYLSFALCITSFLFLFPWSITSWRVSRPK